MIFAISVLETLLRPGPCIKGGEKFAENRKKQYFWQDKPLDEPFNLL
jgi:hypothetical protein